MLSVVTKEQINFPSYLLHVELSENTENFSWNAKKYAPFSKTTLNAEKDSLADAN